MRSRKYRELTDTSPLVFYMHVNFLFGLSETTREHIPQKAWTHRANPKCLQIKPCHNKCKLFVTLVIEQHRRSKPLTELFEVLFPEFFDPTHEPNSHIPRDK